MALDRNTLRDDLVSVIAAGRELSPEHDYALADVFLRHARERLLHDVETPRQNLGKGPIAALIAAGCLALAALLSPFTLFDRSHDADSFNQSSAIPHQFDRGHPFDGPSWWNTP